MIEHKSGKVMSTKYRRPLILVYYEVSFDEKSAIHRGKNILNLLMAIDI